MQINNTQTSFGSVAKALHWVTAALVVTLFPLGYIIAGLRPQSAQEVKEAFFLFSLHKTIGMTVLVLAILRIGWWLFQPRPLPLHNDRPVETIAAQTVHWLLYALILLMPLTGWLHHSATSGLAEIWGPYPQRVSFVPQTTAWEEFFGWAHFATAWLMGIVVALHVGGALKHAIIDRDFTLQRILPFRTPPVSELLTTRHPNTRLSWVATAAVLAAFFAVLALLGPDSHHTNDVQVADATGDEDSWMIDHAESTLKIVVEQNGTATTGEFANWTGKISFSPETPQDAAIDISINVTSLALGSITQQALSGDYLKSEEHPTALYRGHRFVPVDSGKFQVDGEMELAGIVRPLTLVFDLEVEGQKATANGQATIHRIEYDIGSPDETVGYEVKVLFAVVASQM